MLSPRTNARSFLFSNVNSADSMIMVDELEGDDDDDTFLVDYHEIKDGVTSPSSVSALLKVQNSFIGGICIVPSDESENPDAQIYSKLWKDCTDMKFEEEKCQVIFNNNAGVLIFSGQGDLIFFRSKFEQFSPTLQTFNDVAQLSFIARKSTCVRSNSRRMTAHLGAETMDEPLDDMKNIDFEVFAYKH